MKTIIKYLLTLSIVILHSNANLVFSQSDFWSPTRGPFGGTAREIYVSTNGNILTGSFNGGIFSTTDGGHNWNEAGLGGKSPYGIAVNQSGHIFAGTSHGTYRSIDNGQTWQLVYDFTLNTLVISSLQYIIGGSQGSGPTIGSILRSTDNGNSWETYGPLNTAVFSLSIDLNGRLYAGSVDGVYRSTDEGLNWSSIGLPGQLIFSIALDSSNNIFAGSVAGIHKSTDNGITWNFSSLGNQVNDIKIANSQTMYAGTFFNGVFRSTNNGSSWTGLNTGLTNRNVWCLGINLLGDIIAGTEGGGIFRLPFKGNSWIQADNGFSNTFINVLAKSPNGTIFAGTGELFGYVYQSTNNGNDWARLNTGITNPVASLGINNNGNIFAGTLGGGILRSLNNGIDWTQVNNGLTNFNISSIAFTSTQNVFAASEGGGVFRSTDNGNNWSPVNNGIINFTMTSLAKNSSDAIYTGSYGHGVYSTTNEGQIWISINSDLPDLQIISMAINSSGHIFVGTENAGVFKSTNSGSSWLPLGLGNARVIELTVALNNQVFAGSNYEGAFHSTDNGNNWIQINGGLTNTIVPSILVHSTGYVFAGTYGNGVFKSINQITDIANLTLTIPTEFELYDNYPNPFNPSTTIRFKLPVESIVKLSIYDIIGSEVSILVYEKLRIGIYEYQWNASQFSSGTYFCRIESEGFTKVKKMTLIK